MRKVANGLVNKINEKNILKSSMQLVFEKLKKGERIGDVFGISNKYSDAIYSLAYFYFENARYEDALGLFKMLSMIDVNDKRGMLGSGLCYKQMNQFDEAIRCLGLAYVCDPADARIAVHVAHCLVQSGRRKEASELLLHMENDGEKFDYREGLSDSLCALKKIIKNNNY